MTELLDKRDKQPDKCKHKYKLINSILIVTLISFLFFIIIKISNDWIYKESPFLPNYTIIYVNGILINYSVFLSFGLIPGLYLRSKGKYAISSYIIVVFIILGFLLKDVVKYYEFLY